MRFRLGDYLRGEAVNKLENLVREYFMLSSFYFAAWPSILL